ncbi:MULTISPECIES: glycosyltransferase family 2 protein [Larkinella]|uniref:Glycosyltransferase family 2 protein n=2 Tax=Larkinella TaxID=332157 RepID=A0A5N1JF40_9BACT|nr:MULTISPECIES: glycosyltransferase family 2 protein [Larkinella]KAA9354006.1 glycosyltransferase family 2 protein [Larkinella humicola]RCR68070.1 glycosyltransferase family 2 protein [Larkinella punicea]
MKSLRVLVVVPCYNEQRSVAAVVNDIHWVKTRFGLSLDTLVVNDCSTDNTMAVVRTLDCLHLDLPVNLGIGGCMQAGYKYAYRKGYDIAVQIDGDGQHPAEGLIKLLRPLFDDQADVVIGSRFLERQGFQSSFVRRIGIRYFRWLNQLLIRKTVHDSTSGFRAFNRKTIEIVNRYYPDEYPEPEAIVQFGLHKLRLLEVPVLMEERQGGTSSIGWVQSVYYLFKVTLGTLFVYIRLRKI